MNEERDKMTNAKRRVSDLCRDSLDLKWFKGSGWGITDGCPFCHDANYNCDRCLCPSEICEDNAERGYIYEILVKNGRITVGELPEDVLNKMVNLFKKYIISED